MLKQIETSNPHNSMGIDKASPKEIREAGKSVVEGLGKVINRSFLTQTFPETWETAKLKSAYKKGCKLDRGNYRHLSLLGLPSKIAEG